MKKLILVIGMALSFGAVADEYAEFLKELAETDSKPPPSQMPWETNYWECILDEMPGVKTKTVAYSVRNKCKKYSRYYKITKKSSLFGIKDANDCIIEYAKDTVSSSAAKVIRQACYKLYVR